MNDYESPLINKSKWARCALAILLTVAGVFVWLSGVQKSPLLDKEILVERAYARKILFERSSDYDVEKQLAEAYWQRYPDIRKDSVWGEKGNMGIRGPRDHFRIHGKREGRIWGLERDNNL